MGRVVCWYRGQISENCLWEEKIYISFGKTYSGNRIVAPPNISVHQNRMKLAEIMGLRTKLDHTIFLFRFFSSSLTKLEVPTYRNWKGPARIHSKYARLKRKQIDAGRSDDTMLYEYNYEINSFVSNPMKWCGTLPTKIVRRILLLNPCAIIFQKFVPHSA